MVKKLQKMADKASNKKAVSPAALLDTQLAATIKDSAQQIWLAGLGAFAKAQEEGGKVFEALVKEGVSLQKKTQAVAEDKISGVTSKVSHVADGITAIPAKAGQQWDKLEGIFEQRVAKAQNKLGVPSRKDIDALSRRIDDLAAAVTSLGGKTSTARARKAARSVSATGQAVGTQVNKAVGKAMSKATKVATNGAARVKRAVRQASA
jgi:poly(hydroxyalkanoate) granule-associated protein